ncbi:MAG TPA: Flp family type IVb pilin [Paludibaculum sp.]|jgi:pilus assembly protein Flp/PilA
MNLIKKFWNEEDGQDLIEYALLAGTIALAVGGTMITIGASITTIFTGVNTDLDTVAKLP